MKLFPSALLGLLGLAIASFAAHIAISGAEPALPRDGDFVEGTVAEGGGALQDSPAGRPFYYGEVRIQQAGTHEQSTGSSYWHGTFGRPEVPVTTARGSTRIELPPPAEWKMLADLVDVAPASTLRGLPLIGDVQVGERLRPPFDVSVRAVRPGTPLVAALRDGDVTRVWIGDRATLERERSDRDTARWPIVGMLAAMAIGTFVGAYRLAGRMKQPAG
ncbi:MAG: hypothetical protein U0230_12435 [Polyangiales bacterium]